MGALDLGSKIVLEVRPQDLVDLAFPGVVARGPVGSEVAGRQLISDGVLEGEQDGSRVTLHFEVEAEPSSGATPQAARNACGLLYRYARPVRTTILYLHPAKDGRRPARSTILRIGERPVEVEFRIVVLWEDLEAEATLAGTTVGLLPFAGLMRGGSLDVVRRAAARLTELVPERQKKVDLQAALFFLSGLEFQKDHLYGILNKEELMESATYRAVVEEARAEGRLELLLKQLRMKLGDAATPFTSRVSSAPESILDEVNRLVVTVADADAFRQELDALLPVPPPDGGPPPG